MAKHTEFGRLGEQMAVDFLLHNRYEILARNYRYLKAEIDIIAQKENTLVVIEVKSRNMGFLEDISNTVNRKKVGLLTLAANQFVQDWDLEVEVRFDIIKVVKHGNGFEIEHLENAFYYF
jgi:putative endonuclease